MYSYDVFTNACAEFIEVINHATFHNSNGLPPQSARPCEDVRQDVGAVLHTNLMEGKESGTVTNRAQRERKTAPQQAAFSQKTSTLSLFLLP